MSTKSILATLKKYQRASRTSALRRGYLHAFELKMIYRTTKMENPEVTRQMVATVLGRFRQ